MQPASVALVIPTLAGLRRTRSDGGRSVAASMQVTDVQMALLPVVERIVTASLSRWGSRLPHRLDRDLLNAFADAIGTGFLHAPTEASENESWLHISGIFGYRYRQVDIRLRLELRELESGEQAMVALIDALFLPAHAQNCGAGTALIRALAVLWARMGVAEMRATASGDGSCTFASWGFDLDPNDRQTAARCVREELAARSGLDGAPNPAFPPPSELTGELQRLLDVGPSASPALDIKAIYHLATVDGDRYGARLLHGVMWPARLVVDPAWASGEGFAI